VTRSLNQMLFHLETFPAGTTFSTWLRLRRPTPIEYAFFREVLDEFTTAGFLGGRVGIGHGQVRADLAVAGLAPGYDQSGDWRAMVAENRDEILTALQGLA